MSYSIEYIAKLSKLKKGVVGVSFHRNSETYNSLGIYIVLEDIILSNDELNLIGLNIKKGINTSGELNGIIIKDSKRYCISFNTDDISKIESL